MIETYDDENKDILKKEKFLIFINIFKQKMMFIHENEKKQKKIDFDFSPRINKKSLNLAK